MVLYWPFNEATGTMAYDRSGFGLNGMLWAESGGTLPQWIDSVDTAHGKALRFGDYLASAVYTPYHPRLDLAGHWTIACWVRQDDNADPSHGGYGRLLSAENYEMELGQAGDTNTYWWTWGYPSWEFVTGPSPALDQWHHIAVTYDGTTFRQYIDGSQVFTKTGLPSSLPRYSDNTWENLTVGVQANFPSSSHMVGAVDDVAIWNETLDSGQIADVMDGDFSAWVPAGEEAVAINFFDIRNSYKGEYTCWDNGRSDVYVGSPATVSTCSGSCLPVDMTAGEGSLVLTTTLPSGWWNVLFYFDSGHSVNFLRTGSSPLLHLRVKWGAIASGADLRIELMDDTAIWNLDYIYAGQTGPYSNQTASVYLSSYVTPSTSSWQDVYIPMSAFLSNNPALDITRITRIAFFGTGTYSATNTLYIEKMRIVPAAGSEYTDMVKVNQFGYLPGQRKLAIVSYENPAVTAAPTYFQVKNASTGSVVHQASLQSDQPCSFSWDRSGDTVFHADFTSFTTPGCYVIYVPEIDQTSVPFYIDADVYTPPLRDALRFFYYARSGNEVSGPYAEGFARPTIYANNSACVYDYDDEDPEFMYDYDPLNQGITSRDVCGGWFDAGDLHLDTHNNIATLWFLLETLEQFQSKVGPDTLNLPESDGTTSDLVLLIKYQLDWFKKMQNSDGSVHFMVICQDGDQSHQHISDVSSGATCILAAVFAKAYPIFSGISGMGTYASDLLSRAQSAWTWLSAHPDTYDPAKPGGGYYTYHIADDGCFRALAAIELYIATGTTSYRTYFDNAFNAEGGNALTAWGNNQSWGGILGLIGSLTYSVNMGYMDYVETSRAVDTTIKNHLIDKFTDQADFILDNIDCSTYNTPMVAPNHLFWGSSAMFCANAYVLLRVYDWTSDSDYLNGALDALDWVSGRNPVCRNFISGYGDYLHGSDIYSFYWFDHSDPVPGYLSGNINCNGFGSNCFLDPHIRFPWKYYLNLQNAAILEPCINWQAELCYLLAYFGSSLPAPVTLLSDGFESSFNNWTDGGTTDWDRATSQKYSGSYSAHAGSSDNDLISDNLDTTNFASVTITFRYMDDDIDDGDNVYLQLYNGTGYIGKVELGITSPEDTWHQCSVTIRNKDAETQYFRSNFRIKFEGTSIDLLENLWIDDITIVGRY